MHWQDIVLTIGQFAFVVALIPSLKQKHKPPLTTSVMNTLTLFVFGGVYMTLFLWFAAVMTMVTGAMWAVLAIQKKLEKK